MMSSVLYQQISKHKVVYHSGLRVFSHLRKKSIPCCVSFLLLITLTLNNQSKRRKDEVMQSLVDVTVLLIITLHRQDN